VDFEKSFDKVQYNAIIYMLRYLRFGDKFISWIENILGSATTSIILNGVPGKTIKCMRGVIQGDPLSPILFVLAAELLQIVVNNAWINEEIQLPLNNSYGQDFPIIQYADDTLLILPDDAMQLSKVKEILDIFSLSTGLFIKHTYISVSS
jgi:hypothetical protein